MNDKSLLANFVTFEKQYDAFYSPEQKLITIDYDYTYNNFDLDFIGAFKKQVCTLCENFIKCSLSNFDNIFIHSVKEVKEIEGIEYPVLKTRIECKSCKLDSDTIEKHKVSYSAFNNGRGHGKGG